MEMLVNDTDYHEKINDGAKNVFLKTCCVFLRQGCNIFKTITNIPTTDNQVAFSTPVNFYSFY